MKQLLIVNLILTGLGLSLQRIGKVISKDTISITDMEPKRNNTIIINIKK